MLNNESLAPVPASQHQTSNTPVKRHSLLGAKVLVAEDNLVNLEVARFHLEDLGCVPASATNGAEAVELSKSEAFDFILMDCQMPVMDGFAALAAIRALGPGNANSNAKILAVTAADDAQTMSNCVHAGFDGFLSKPFSAEQLRAALLNEPPPASAVSQRSATGSTLLDATTFGAFVADFGFDTAPSLIASYVKLLSDSITRFDQCSSASDTSGLQALGHKLAGASGMIGATRLQASAKNVDVQGKAKKLKISEEVLAMRADITATLEGLLPLQTEADLRRYLNQN